MNTQISQNDLSHAQRAVNVVKEIQIEKGIFYGDCIDILAQLTVNYVLIQDIAPEIAKVLDQSIKYFVIRVAKNFNVTPTEIANDLRRIIDVITE